jgi:3-hydroxyisobutyrate dehydrogenase
MEFKNVGLVGTGQMGMPMGQNLLRAGYALTVFARRKEATSPLVEKGAKSVESPAEVFSRSSVVILALPGPAEVKEIIFGNGGLSEGQDLPGKIVIDTSTIDPESSRDMARKLKSLNVDYLDAPVSGGPEGSSKATLTFMVGGNRVAFERCHEVFSTMGKNIFYTGDSGSGTGAKLINQLLVASNTLATAEAMQLCSALGLNSDQIIDIIKTSAGDSFIFRRVAPNIAHETFGPGWQTYLIEKDLRLLAKTTADFGLPSISVKNSLDTFSRSVQAGLGKVDAASVIKTLDKMKSEKPTTG